MKKNLLNRLTVVIASLMPIVYLSCQHVDIDSQGSYLPKFETNSLSAYNVDAVSPQIISFNLNSNTPWRIVSDKSWCRVTPNMSGSSSLIEEITIEVDDNDVVESRCATITVSAEGVDENVVITITQDAKGELIIQPIDNIIPTGGGVSTFTVKSNKPWRVSSEKQWLSFDKQFGEGGETVEIITATSVANPGQKRTSIVTVFSGTEERSFVATQNGLVLEFAPVEDEYKTFHRNGQTKTFEVLSSVDWKAESNNPDVTLKKLNSSQLSVEIAPNKLFATRNFEVTLSPVSPGMGGVQSEAIELKQPTNYVYGDFGTDPNGGQKIINNETGSVTLNEGTVGNVRMTTNEVYKLGEFIWKFSNTNINIVNSGFHVQTFAASGNFNYRVRLGYDIDRANVISSGGATPNGTSFWADFTPLSFTQEQINNMHTLKISLMPETATDQLVIKVWINDTLIAGDNKRTNPWKVDATAPGFQYYFGFLSKNGTSSMTIDSFEFIPYEE